MATEKKKEVKVRDLKPSKDAKGGVAKQNTQTSLSRPASTSTSTKLNSPTRNLL